MVDVGPAANKLTEFGRVGSNDDVVEVFNDMDGVERMDTTNYGTILFFREQVKSTLDKPAANASHPSTQAVTPDWHSARMATGT